MSRTDEAVADASLPTGTVTFLFTDIEGSTRMLRELGERYAEQLTAHFEIMSTAIAAGGGSVVGTEGDAVFAAFPSAPRAVAAVVDAQRALYVHDWPAAAPIRVRMGLHTGEGTLAGDTYVGIDVHRAARIGAVAHGGQVLLSASTFALTGSALPEGVSTRDLGAHRLKDLAEPERLFQLIADGLPSEFPPIRSLENVPNNLPIQLTTFLGRQREIAEVSAALGESRLLTLTGPGGTGKTRLSLQVAADMADRFPHGIYFVGLAPISDSALVPISVARALGLQDTGGRSVAERLTDWLAGKEMLLVLDNFEQVLPAGPMVAELLQRAPELRVLVTSRAPLRLSGEREYPVPPLGLPDVRRLPPLESLSQYEAVALFIERALSVKPDFAVTNDNAPAVAEIAARLDGLPLAIELAAARVRVLPPQAILARLGHRLSLLASGARDLPSRQQTLRGAIAWSHDLLDTSGRRLFARLAAFVGGAGLEEVETICGPADELGSDVLDGLEALVEQSLVQQREDDGEPRFVMLETIREFADEQLEGSGEADAIRGRHAATFLSVAERAAPHLTGGEQRTWLDRLEREHDNLRAAMEWAIGRGDAETALRFGAALWRFWQIRGYLGEGRGRLERALAVAADVRDSALHAAALQAAGGIAYWQADLDAALSFYSDELQLRRQLPDRGALAYALYCLAMTHTFLGTPGTMAEGRPYAEEGLELYRELGDEVGVATLLWSIACIDYYARRDFKRARERNNEAQAIIRRRVEPFLQRWCIFMAAMLDIAERDMAPARRNLREALALARDAGDVSAYALIVAAASWMSWEAADRTQAMRLAGAANVLETSSGARLAEYNRDTTGSFRAEDWLDDAELQAAYVEGQAMSPDDAAAYAAEALTG